MPVVVPLVAAGVSAAASIAGAAMGAGANQGIASAQEATAQANRAQALQFAAPTPQEMQSISDQINNQSRYQAIQQASVDRDTGILNSLDPALVTAGQQANQLMQGQSAAIIQPMLQQQALQRGQLQQQLAAQLGPGWATSSAGVAAMNSFNTQANLSTAQAQMTAFNQVSQFLNFGTQSSNAINASDRSGFEANARMSGEILGEEGNIQQRQVGAALGTQNQTFASAGSQFAGQAATGASIQGLADSAGKIGGTIAGYAMGSQNNITPTNPASTPYVSSLGVGGGQSLGNPNLGPT
jgi:hypothetical protein